MYLDIGPTNTAELRQRVMQFLNPFCTEQCLNDLSDGKLKCDCGNLGNYNWTWERQEDTNVAIAKISREITFHPVYSSGTAALRGSVPFQTNLHHYFEMKMLSNLYGTDVMVGVGTSRIVFSDWKFRFFSLLGFDKQSWGYSYNGTIQHNGLAKNYGGPFGLGSLVGVHLDMCNGTIEYYLNRKPLGVAFKGLKSKELYPMICSTAAQSAMKMTCAVSLEPNLQLKCLQIITKVPKLFAKFKSTPGLARIYERKYFWLIQQDNKRPDLELTALGTKLRTKRRKKVLPIQWDAGKKPSYHELRRTSRAGKFKATRPPNDQQPKGSDSEDVIEIIDLDSPEYQEPSTSNKL